MAGLPELEQAFIKADTLASKSDATPEARAAAQADAAMFAKEIKRQRSMQKVDENVPRGEFDLALAERPKTSWLDSGREMLTSAGAGTAGQIIGSAIAPGVGTVVGGAIGQGAANVTNQLQRMAKDPNEKFRWGELAADIGTGAIPGGPAAKSGAKAVLREGVKQGAAGFVAGNVQKLIDEGRPMDVKESLFATAIPFAGGAAAHQLLSGAPSTKLAVAEAEARRSGKSAHLEAGQELGLKVVPSKVDFEPSWLTKQSESLAGKAALPQQAQIDNARAVDRAVKQEFNWPVDRDLTPADFREIRRKAGLIYEEVGKIGEEARSKIREIEATRFTASDPHQLAIQKADPATVAELQPLTVKAVADVEKLKELRGLAQKHRDRYLASKGMSPEENAKALEYREQAHELEQNIEEAMRTAGRPELADQLKAARERIAKTYNAEDAQNLGDYSFDAKQLGNQLDRGAPLSGNLRTIAEFQRAFPHGFQEQAKIQTPGVDALGLMFRTAAAGGTYAATQNLPASLLAVAAPSIAGGAARRTLLSGPVQRHFAGKIAPEIFLNPAENALATGLRMGSQQAAQAATALPEPPDPAIEHLRKHPELADEFDAKYGRGQAAKFLKRK